MNLGYMTSVNSPHKEATWEEKALAKVQSQLSPKDASKVVAIRLEGDGFTLGEDYVEARIAFRKKFPNEGAFFTRVDGSPVMTVPWSHR